MLGVGTLIRIKCVKSLQIGIVFQEMEGGVRRSKRQRGDVVDLSDDDGKESDAKLLRIKEEKRQLEEEKGQWEEEKGQWEEEKRQWEEEKMQLKEDKGQLLSFILQHEYNRLE